MLSDAVLENFADTNAGNKAREFFKANGLPKRKSEDFHYFDISKALEMEIDAAALFAVFEADSDYDLDIHVCDDGIVAKELKDPKPNKIKTFNPNIEEFAPPIDILSSGMANSGNTIIIPPNADHKIRIRHGANTKVQLELVIGKNSNIILYEEIEENGGFGTCHFTIAMAEGSQLTHLFFNSNESQISFFRHRVFIDANANYSFHGMWNGSKISRHDLAVYLNEKGSHAQINGAYLIDKQHLDLSVYINHQEPECKSSVNIRGIVGDRGQAVFQGKIEVDKEAQKTIGNMQHRGLMLQEGARIYSKPCLEIYADDVECSHANTVGALDETALFYMQSRGISKKIAKQVLTNAFLSQVFDNFEDEALHEKLIARLEKRLGEIVS